MRALSLSLLLSLVASLAEPCTTFCTRGLFGRNYDFETGNGAVMVNKRGVRKASAAARGAVWTSRFGSVTFNQFGRDNPTGGMNEAGLVVELMWLSATDYPRTDGREEVGTLEWLQYQLDTAATVDEAIANAGRIRIANARAPLHFLLADAGGAVATVEFLHGELVVHRGSELPVPVLANDTYARSLEAMRRGTRDRFARAAARVGEAKTVDDAFAILDDVAQPITQWSIVYDIPRRTVTWRTTANRARRSVRFARLDFRCGTPVTMLGIDEGSGDVAARFVPYSTSRNLELVRRSIRAVSFTRDLPESEIEATARQPERSQCSATAAPPPGR